MVTTDTDPRVKVAKWNARW